MVLKKGMLLSFLCIINLLRICGQGNLVPNGSFESYTTCPATSGKLQCTGNWYLPTGATADFFHQCAQNGFSEVGVPINFFGSQWGFNNGLGYAGFYACGGNYREYIQTRLSSPLVAGQMYHLSFYVSLADSVILASDRVGAYLSVNSAIPWYANGILTATPQVCSPKGLPLTNAIGWRKVGGVYTALGGEEYITIGNFTPDSLTTTIKRLNKPWPFPDFSYYYVDEICLSSNPQTCYVPLGIEEYSNSAPFFYYDISSQSLLFNDKASTYTVSLLDLFGNLVKTFKLTGETQASLSELPAGCYLVHANNGQQEAIQKIVIWQ